MNQFVKWVTEKRWAAFVAMALAAIQLAVGFGLDITETQVTLLASFLTAVGGFLIQAKVWSRESVDILRSEVRGTAYRQGVKDSRELDRATSEEGGVGLDALGGLGAILLAMIFAWAVAEQIVGLLAGFVKAVLGW